MSSNPSLQFIGAAQQVTGSCYLIRVNHKNILLDCGMVQGANRVREWHRFRFKFRPDSIDLVVLSHAHIDHSGLLPLLVAKGFRGKILCTPGTRALLPVLLKDSVLLYCLGQLYHQGRLKQKLIFLDSPMASSITDIYNGSLQRLDKSDTREMSEQNAQTLQEFLPLLRITESVDDSIAINRISQGAIVIAGSGMCNGGRITHHLKHNLWNTRNHILFVGFQARGTLGRRLVDGDAQVKLFGQTIAVKARIHTLGGFSAHAGQSQLLEWARHIGGDPRFYLIHGEPEALEPLRLELEKKGIHAEIPELRQKVDL